MAIDPGVGWGPLARVADPRRDERWTKDLDRAALRFGQSGPPARISLFGPPRQSLACGAQGRCDFDGWSHCGSESAETDSTE